MPVKKGPELTIYEDRPKEFWCDMGPFFGLRSIRREMPYLVDDDGYVWFCLRDAGAVVGFGSLHVDRKAVGILHGLYVVPERRQNGLAARLVEERLKWLKERGVKRCRTTATQESVNVHALHGFSTVGQKGSYYTMERDL